MAPFFLFFVPNMVINCHIAGHVILEVGVCVKSWEMAHSTPPCLYFLVPAAVVAVGHCAALASSPLCTRGERRHEETCLKKKLLSVLGLFLSRAWIVCLKMIYEKNVFPFFFLEKGVYVPCPKKRVGRRLLFFRCILGYVSPRYVDEKYSNKYQESKGNKKEAKHPPGTKVSFKV